MKLASATPVGIALAVSLSAFTASAAVKIEKKAYDGWPNCYRMTNGEIELIVTTDIGPRIMRLGFVGGQNFFKEFKDQLGKSHEKDWQLRGGHRIWVAPEMVPESYAPDNVPVQAVVQGDSITLTEPVEPGAGFQKQMTIQMASSGPNVKVTHRIRNANKTTKHITVWSMSMMAQNGTAISGFPPRGSHDVYLQPTNPLTMWAYTDFSDPRWKFTKKYITLHQDPKNSESEKTGLYNQNTFGAYLLGTELFVKRYKAEKPVTEYPDFGCSYEMYTNNEFLEIETLGPLQNVAPQQQIEHVEQWTLQKNVHIPSLTDAALDHVLQPILSK